MLYCWVFKGPESSKDETEPLKLHIDKEIKSMSRDAHANEPKRRKQDIRSESCEEEIFLRSGDESQMITRGKVRKEFNFGSKRSKKEENHFKDQARKSVGRMPWHQEPKKDAISCEKPRGGANIH